MRNDFVKFAALAGVLMVAGCKDYSGPTFRFKGVESFKTATTPVDYDSQGVDNQAKGDPYASGGIAYASAASRVHTRYGAGSNPNSPEKVDSRLDRPAKGSGQQPGEEGGDAAAGQGKSNAPANQPAASVDSAANH